MNVLTDLTSDFKELISMVSDPTGREKLVEFLGEDAEKVIGFFFQEYLTD